MKSVPAYSTRLRDQSALHIIFFRVSLTLIESFNHNPIKSGASEILAPYFDIAISMHSLSREAVRVKYIGSV
jgi:hypothetical protein